MDIDKFIIGKSKNVMELKLLIKKVAPTESTVLALGESGTGQELVADRQDIELEDSDFKNPSEISLGLGIGKANKWYAGLEYVNCLLYTSPSPRDRG